MQKYDYLQNGYYFITICANNKQHVFVEIISVVGDGLSVPTIKLNENGKIVDEYIKNIAIKYWKRDRNTKRDGKPVPYKRKKRAYKEEFSKKQQD